MTARCIPAAKAATRIGTVHVLGAGAIGLLHAAHLQLALKNRPSIGSVALLLREPSMSLFLAQNRTVSIHNTTNTSHLNTVIDCEPIGKDNEACIATQHLPPISTLIVATKAHQTWPALVPILPRLDSAPIILLLQNGVLGVHAQIAAKLAAARPDVNPIYLLGMTSHGSTRNTKTNRFAVFRNGLGRTVLGRVASAQGSSIGVEADRRADAVLDTLASIWSEPLSATVLDPKTLFAEIVLKLVVNACLNPVVALLGCLNGGLLESDHGTHTVHALCTELAPICLPMLRLLNITSVEDLTAAVLDVARNTSTNRNSMLVDIEAGSNTEIDFLNGYLLELARKRGLAMPMHDLLVRLIHLRSSLKKFKL